MTIKEHDTVRVIQDVPAEKVKRGMIGAVIHIATKPSLAYMVEFCDNEGQTILWPFLLPEQIEKAENLTKEEYRARVMPEGEPI